MRVEDEGAGEQGEECQECRGHHDKAGAPHHNHTVCAVTRQGRTATGLPPPTHYPTTPNSSERGFTYSTTLLVYCTTNIQGYRVMLMLWVYISTTTINLTENFHIFPRGLKRVLKCSLLVVFLRYGTQRKTHIFNIYFGFYIRFEKSLILAILFKT